MGVKTLYEYFYKLAYGDKGADKAILVNDCLDVADAQIEANKNPYTNMVKCSDYNNPDDAITAIGASNKTLLVTEAETCDTNFTVPTNVSVKFERGGKWTIATGITVTFNGQIDAGLWQIFGYAGTGIISFSTGIVKEVYPEWWGIDGTDDHTEINAAITASANGGVVKLQKSYTLGNSISVNKGFITIEGSAGRRPSITFSGTSGNPLFLLGYNYNITIRNLKLYCDNGAGSIASYGIYGGNSSNVTMNLLFEDLEIADASSAGIHYIRLMTSTFNRIYIKDCGAYGINIIGHGTSLQINNCYTQNSGYGFRLETMCYSTLNACASDSNDYGYYILDGHGVGLYGCGVEDCTTGFFISGIGNGVYNCRAVASVAQTRGFWIKNQTGCALITPIVGANITDGILLDNTDTGITGISIVEPVFTSTNSIVTAGSPTSYSVIIGGKVAFGMTNVTAKTTTATLIVAEAGTIKVSAAAAYTITLPTAVGNIGLTYHFIKTDANYNLITLDGNGTETLNYENSTGAPTLTYPRLNTYCAEVTIVSDGANWQCINEKLGQVPECSASLVTAVPLKTTVTLTIELDTVTFNIGNNLSIANWITGSATATTATHLIDTTNNPFTSAMVGYRVKNTTDTTYTYITVYNSASDVTVADDIFVNGEGYLVKHSEFTAPVSGKYLVTGSIHFATGMEDQKKLMTQLVKNTTAFCMGRLCSSGTEIQGASATGYLSLSIGDVIKLFGYHTMTGNLSTYAGAGYTVLTVRLVSKD